MPKQLLVDAVKQLNVYQFKQKDYFTCLVIVSLIEEKNSPLEMDAVNLLIEYQSEFRSILSKRVNSPLSETAFITDYCRRYIVLHQIQAPKKKAELLTQTRIEWTNFLLDKCKE